MAGAEVAAAATIGLEGLLAAQEGGAEAARDRAARAHGEASLALLESLRAALLTGAETEPVREQLAAHAARMTPAADPRLQAAQRAIALRVAVELARRG
jgi:hypothetical protein